MSEQLTLTGTISHICRPTIREHNGTTYRTQKVLIEIPGYNGRIEIIPVEINQKIQDRIDEYAKGQQVTAYYEFKGNGYTNKTTNEPDAFLKLNVWRMDKIGGAVPAPSSSEPPDNLPF